MINKTQEVTELNKAIELLVYGKLNAETRDEVVEILHRIVAEKVS